MFNGFGLLYSYDFFRNHQLACVFFLSHFTRVFINSSAAWCERHAWPRPCSRVLRFDVGVALWVRLSV